MYTLVLSILFALVVLCSYIIYESDRITHILEMANEKMKLFSWLETTMSVINLGISSYKVDISLRNTVEAQLNPAVSDIDEKSRLDIMSTLDRVSKGSKECLDTIIGSRAQVINRMEILIEELGMLKTDLNKSPMNTKDAQESLMKDIDEIQKFIDKTNQRTEDEKSDN